MKKSGYYMSILTGSMVFLNASVSLALIPTVDASAIAEGIKSNIELVKQSKIVVEATKLTGEISATLGDIKASISELSLDELKKAKEFVEKQKENYEKAKEDYEEYKKKIEEAKAELEEGKKLLEEAKNKTTGAVSYVTNTYDDVKDKYNDTKEKVDNTIEKATDSDNEAKGYYEESNGSLSDTLNNSNSAKDTGSSSGSSTTPSYTPTYSPSTTPIDLKVAQSEIEALRAEIERLKAAQSQTGYNNDEPEQNVEPQNLEEALEEIARLKEELEKYQEENKNREEIDESLETPNNIILEQGIEQPIPVTAPQKEPDEQEETPQNTKNFRQRPTINNTTLYDINASVEDLVAETYAYSVEVSERLNFAQLDVATENIPTGDNDVTGEFIISQEMAQHCKVNINIATIDQLENCIKEIITYRSNPDMKVAEKGDALVDKIFYENAVGTAAAAMYAHNKASHYKEEVLIPMKADSAEGQSDVRDDISVLTSAQEQVQNLLIDLTKAYAAQVYQQSIKDALQTRLKDIDPEAALAAQNANTENSEESLGE